MSAQIATLSSARDLRARGNTFKALLEDTCDLLESLNYATQADREAVEVQIEAIRNALTAGED